MLSKNNQFKYLCPSCFSENIEKVGATHQHRGNCLDCKNNWDWKRKTIFIRLGKGFIKSQEYKNLIIAQTKKAKTSLVDFNVYWQSKAWV